MAIPYDVFKANEQEVRELCAAWIKADFRDKSIENKLRRYGFSSWNLLAVAKGEIEYEI